MGKNVWSILPFFLLSVGISAWVTVSGFADRIKAVFTRRENIAVAGAAIVGATVPLCSCGVIPLIAAMLATAVLTLGSCSGSSERPSTPPRESEIRWQGQEQGYDAKTVVRPDGTVDHSSSQRHWRTAEVHV